MSELANDVKIAIIEDEMEGLRQLNFRLSLRASIRLEIGDNDAADKIAVDMVKNALILSKYQERLEETKQEVKTATEQD
jgi:hypothetical protein